MPLYEFKCSKCNKVWERLVPISARNAKEVKSCPECGGEGKRVFGSISVHVWQPRWYEHIDTKPIYIESKKQLKRECEKRGLVALALE